jgi:DNA-binding HxlR family transcriptional regulator
LAATLRLLERDGYVSRQAYASIPPRVEYELTPLGLALAERVRHLEEFALTNAARITAARTEFADRAAAF